MHEGTFFPKTTSCTYIHNYISWDCLWLTRRWIFVWVSLRNINKLFFCLIWITGPLKESKFHTHLKSCNDTSLKDWQNWTHSMKWFCEGVHVLGQISWNISVNIEKKKKKLLYQFANSFQIYYYGFIHSVVLLSLFQFLGASKWLPFPSSMVISWASPSGAELPLDFCYFETCHCKNPRTNLNIDYSFSSYKGLELFNYQKPKLR